LQIEEDGELPFSSTNLKEAIMAKKTQKGKKVAKKAKVEVEMDECVVCGAEFPVDKLDDGYCPNCVKTNFMDMDECVVCGAEFPVDKLDDGYCPNCVKTNFMGEDCDDCDEPEDEEEND